MSSMSRSIATDRQGKRVTDLRKGDFEVLEDGKPVEISNFETVSRRRNPQAQGTVPGPADAAAAPASPAVSREDAWNLVIFFDNFNLRAASRGRVVRQLGEFLERQLVPGDRVMILTYDLGLHVQLPFTSDPAVIAKALPGLEHVMVRGPQLERDRRQAFETMMAIQEESLSGPEPLPCPQNIVAPAQTYAEARRQETLNTIGSLTLLVNSLSGVPGPKALIHVTDGLPLTPGEELFQFLVELCGGGATSGFGRSQMSGGEQSESPEGNYDPMNVYDARTIGPQAYQAASQAAMDAQHFTVRKELQSLAAHANAHRVTLYTVQAGLAGPDSSDAGFGPNDRLFQFPAIGSTLRASNRESLQLLADSTGGRSILDTNNFLPDLTRIREDFENHYSLGYIPPHTGDGKEHRIEIRTKRPGLQLRYRQTYRDKSTTEKMVDRTLAALLYGIEDNPLEIGVEIGEQSPGPKNTIAVPVRLKIPLFKLAILNREETFEGTLRLLVATEAGDGSRSPVRQVPVPIRIPRKEVLTAMGQFYLYTLTLQLRPGEQQVALGVRDEIGATTSYLSRAVTVGELAAAKP